MSTLAPIPDRRPVRSVAAAMVADFLAVAVGWFVFNIIRFYSLPLSYVSHLGDWLCTRTVLLGQFLIPVAMVGIYAFTGCYAKRLAPASSRLDLTLNALTVSAVGTLGIFFSTLINDDIPERLANYEILLILLVCLALPVMIERWILTSRTLKRLRYVKESHRRAMIVYARPRMAPQIGKLVDFARMMGYQVVAVQCSKPEATFGDVPTVTGDTAELCARLNIDAVILPVSSTSTLHNKKLMDSLYRLEMPVFVAPTVREYLTMGSRMNAVRQEPLVDVASANISPMTANFKRLTDIVGSLVAMLLLTPVYAAIAMAVKLDSRGPVLYRQERLGRRRKPFKILKFRTMSTKAEDFGPALSREDDPRVTRVGRWLRKYRLDELPQFWNVLMGQMSIVGPRPEREYYALQILEREPSYAVVQQIRPGITSWGMVKYGYASSVDQMLERMDYDILYIRNVSLGIDLKILLHTVVTVVTGRGL